jgi:hypothetical protein
LNGGGLWCTVPEARLNRTSKLLWIPGKSVNQLMLGRHLYSRVNSVYQGDGMG